MFVFFLREFVRYRCKGSWTGFKRSIGDADIQSTPVYFYVQKQRQLSTDTEKIPFESVKINQMVRWTKQREYSRRPSMGPISFRSRELSTLYRLPWVEKLTMFSWYWMTWTSVMRKWTKVTLQIPTTIPCTWKRCSFWQGAIKSGPSLFSHPASHWRVTVIGLFILRACWCQRKFFPLLNCWLLRKSFCNGRK